MKRVCNILLLSIALLGDQASVLLGAAVHLYVTWYAYQASGLFAAFLTFFLPVIAEVFWIFPISNAAGSYWNQYTAALLLTPVGTFLKFAILSYLMKGENSW